MAVKRPASMLAPDVCTQQHCILIGYKGSMG